MQKNKLLTLHSSSFSYKYKKLLENKIDDTLSNEIKDWRTLLEYVLVGTANHEKLNLSVLHELSKSQALDRILLVWFMFVSVFGAQLSQVAL